MFCLLFFGDQLLHFNEADLRRYVQKQQRKAAKGKHGTRLVIDANGFTAQTERRNDFEHR